ncbi:MAG: TetR/AcrR family transcriptional regulator [Gemmatimonadota bacterium]|nr:TetR/AcrR family transcriptional regulator [Gemmatimonadota bacterium]MDH3423451.1 TetR/AcrR family transcriptional regulator [Gemmatimonadota bacterium]
MPAKPYHHGNLRRALIQAALDIARDQGADRVSLRRVARQAGVSHAAPYHHFPDRSALIAAVAEEGFRSLSDAVQAVERSVAPPLERLHAAGVAYVVFAVTNPEQFRLMFSREIADTSPFPELNAAALAARGVLERAVAESRATRAVTTSEAVELAAAWALVHGLATLIIDGQLGAEAMSPDGAASLSRSAINSFWSQAAQ